MSPNHPSAVRHAGGMLLASLALSISVVSQAAPSDLDVSLVNDAPDLGGSGTGALIGFGLNAHHAELKQDGRLAFIASGASCYGAPWQVTGIPFVTLTTSGSFHDVKGPPCSDGNTPGSIARAGVYNAVRLSTGKYLLQADTEGLDIRLRLIRLNADGSVDTSFGTNGALLPTKADGSAVFSGVGIRDSARMVVDSQDRIYISASGNQVARLSAAGVLDTSFGTDGYLTGPLENGVITELAIDGDDHLLLVGRRGEIVPVTPTINVEVQRYWLARYGTDGSHDTSFRNDAGGSANIVRVQPVNSDAVQVASFLLPTASGNMLALVGSQLRRYDSTGALSATAALGSETDAGTGRVLGIAPLFAAVNADGKIVIGGQGSNSQQAPLVRRAAVARFNADFTADTGFDADDATPNGIRAYDLGSSRAFPNSKGRILFGSDGKITLVGRVDGSSGNRLAVVRLVGDGGNGPTPDTTPDGFSFGIQDNAPANTLVTSAPITVNGINAPASISVSLGNSSAYSIGCNNTFVQASGSISTGQTVCVRHMTAGPGTNVQTTLSIGGVNGVFESRVPQGPAPDPVPDEFSFTARNDVAKNADIESEQVAITGFNTAASISIIGGEYQLSGSGQTSAYVSTPGQIQPGQSVRVRVRSAGTDGTSATATLTIGTVSAGFTVTTALPKETSTETVITSNGSTVTLSMAASQGTLADVRAVAQPSGAISGVTYPVGFLAFNIEDVAPGGTVTVQLTLPAGSGANTYIKCNAAGSSCSEFAGASFSGSTVTLTLTDGGRGDSDGVANGVIVDPGAPAVKSTRSGGGGGAFGWGLLLTALVPLLMRHRMRHILR